MEISQYILAGFASAVILLSLWKHFKNRPVSDIHIPEPSVKRKDLFYGYYGAMNDQVAETKDHINIWWEAQFQGHLKAIENIDRTKMFTVLDVTNQCMVKFAEHGRNFKFRPDAEAQLRDLFTTMKQANVLQFVKVLYPMDEPNINSTADDVKQAIFILKKVASEFIELSGVKLGVIYAAKPETYECIEYFDWVGVDDYDEKSTIFDSNGAYTKLKARLHPDQRTVIMPGGAFGQNPVPFVNFAHSNHEVVALVPFVWFGPMQPADKWVGIGQDQNVLKQDYINTGLSLVK
jgi:hypothetical protein